MINIDDSELLPRKRCEEIFHAAQQAGRRAGVEDIEVILASTDDSLTRFANNAIHQNVSERVSSASIRTQFDGRTARVSTNRLHRDGIQAAVDEAIALTKAAAPSDELLPLYGEVCETVHSRYSEAGARCTPEQRAAGVREAVQVVKSAGQNAAGIFATAQNVEVLLNSRGVCRYYFDTLTQFSITAMTSDSSGWAKATSAEHSEVSPVALAERAVRKAELSRRPSQLQPGHYTVILEPAAVLDLVGQIFSDFSGTSLADQRSFLNDRTGQKLFGSNITILDDARHPMQTGADFDGEGVWRGVLTLVEEGVVKSIAHSRSSAAKAGVAPTGHGFPLPNEAGESPVNIVIAGGNATLQDLIASTSTGILVTRLWYIREVEPYEKVMTGMTRDGTFLIRDGSVAEGIRNFRFNQSVIEMLKNVEALTATGRAAGEEAFDMVVPAMKVHEFQFTEVTKF